MERVFRLQLCRRGGAEIVGQAMAFIGCTCSLSLGWYRSSASKPEPILNLLSLRDLEAQKTQFQRHDGFPPGLDCATCLATAV
eukprot:1827815-Rhodomonas_salina.1